MSKFFVALFSGNNLWFTLVMMLLFVTACFGAFWANAGKAAKGIAKAAPGLLTSIGIFGTFFGIVLALLDFSSSNLREGIDNIINGMQTAFITSVVGVFLSLVLKTAVIIYDGRKRGHRQDGTDDLNNRDLIQKFLQQGEDTAKLVEYMQLLLKSVGSDSDNSMIGQVRLLRSDFSDRMKEHHRILNGLALITQKYQNESLKWFHSASEKDEKRAEQMEGFKQELFQKLDDFSQILSRSATEQIIDALGKVIADFNRNITEQFGENFKELNEAVGHLLQWQENYKEQLSEMEKQYAQAVKSVQETAQAVGYIEQSAKSIPQSMQKMEDIIQYNNQQLDQLGGHLQAFSDLRHEAVKSVPEIQTIIKNMLESMETGSRQLQEKIGQAAKDFAVSTHSSITILDDTAQSIRSSSENIRKVAQEQSSENRRIMQGLSDEAQKALTRTGESMQKQLEAMDKAMNEEVNRVMRSMGGSLVTITRTFTEDYRRLVDAMDKVVRSGRIGGR